MVKYVCQFQSHLISFSEKQVFIIASFLWGFEKTGKIS